MKRIFYDLFMHHTYATTGKTEVPYDLTHLNTHVTFMKPYLKIIKELRLRSVSISWLKCRRNIFRVRGKDRFFRIGELHGQSYHPLFKEGLALNTGQITYLK